MNTGKFENILIFHENIIVIVLCSWYIYICMYMLYMLRGKRLHSFLNAEASVKCDFGFYIATFSSLSHHIRHVLQTLVCIHCWIFTFSIAVQLRITMVTNCSLQSHKILHLPLLHCFQMEILNKDKNSFKWLISNKWICTFQWQHVRSVYASFTLGLHINIRTYIC